MAPHSKSINAKFIKLTFWLSIAALFVVVLLQLHL